MSKPGGKRVGAGTPQAAATTVLTSNDLAKVCGTYVTPHYLRAGFGGHQGCVQGQRPGAVAQSVRILRTVANTGAVATFIVKPTGGPYSGEKVTVATVKQNGAWKVSSLRANVPVGP